MNYFSLKAYFSSLKFVQNSLIKCCNYILTVKQRSIAKKYGYLWVTLILFSGSIIGHWYYVFQTGNTLNENLRDTFENWQSGFLQLIWQVAVLTYLWYIGSPQSKEEEERNQEMLQWIMKRLEPSKAEVFIKEMDKKYPKK